MRKRWMRAKGGKELVGWETCIVAAVCDGSVALVTNPFDVIKSRLMDQAGTVQRKSVWGTAAAVVRQSGPVGLMQGCGARVVWLSLGGG